MSRMSIDDLTTAFSSSELLRAVYLDRTNNYISDSKFLDDLGLDAGDAEAVTNALLLCEYLQEREVRSGPDICVSFAQYALWHRVRKDLIFSEWEDVNYDQMRDALIECAQEGKDAEDDTLEVSYNLVDYLDSLEAVVPDWAVGYYRAQADSVEFMGNWGLDAEYQTGDHGDLIHVNNVKCEAYVVVPMCSPKLVLAVTWEKSDDD